MGSFAKQQRRAAQRASLGGTRDRIASGVSIGIQRSLDELAAKVERELAAGYRRIKIKIKPGWDLAAVETVRARFGAIPLMVDANAAYTLADADHLAELDRVRPDDDRAAARLRRHRRSRRAAAAAEDADLSRRVDQDASASRAEAIAAGACRIINIKPGRVGGFGESIRLHDLCASHGIPVWHGGMLESGIGRAANIHLSTLPNFSLPGDIAASKRYFDPDLIEPPIEVAADGTIARARPGPGSASPSDCGSHRARRRCGTLELRT